MMTESDARIDRAAGCILGAFIGDALGLGPHWYYDLDELHCEYGPWITGYTAPKAGRYHEGMRAGELSQTGLIMKFLLESLATRKDYDESDFCRRLDEDFLPHLDGEARGGPGGYTNHSFRQVWKARVEEGRPWNYAAGNADTSEAAERGSLLAARFAGDPGRVAHHVATNTRLSQNDSLVVQQSVAFALVLAALIRGEKFDKGISDKLMADVEDGSVPFLAGSSIASAGTEKPELGFASPDALLLPSWIAQAASENQIDPPWKVSVVYGMSCAINFVLPGAYYLAARFGDDFESAVLHAVNGGGQNMSRACLTGALVGAQVGISRIPSRLIDGLVDGQELVRLSREVVRTDAETQK